MNARSRIRRAFFGTVFVGAVASTAGCGVQGPMTLCTPTTCAAQGAACGSISDGCGATLSCASCSTGRTCNAAHQCVTTCTPSVTCTSASAMCGQVDDGCGNPLACGTCPTGQSCGATYQCSACAPRTCADLGATCGTPPDGCGGTLAPCGVCTAPATCGGGGIPWACGGGTTGGCALATAPPQSGGTTYFVAPTGSDGNPGTMAMPFLTVQHAADSVNPGDTVVVADGVYTGDTNAVLSVGRGGTSTNWVWFRAQNRWGAILDGQNNTSGTGIEIGASFVRVEGFEVRGPNHYGIDPSTSVSDVQIVGNHIHDVGRYCEPSGIGLSAIDAYSSNLTIEQNLVHDIGRFAAGENGCAPGNDYWMNHDHGIYNGAGTNVMIRNNVFYNILHGWPIQFYGGSVGSVYVVENTFVFPNPNREGQIIVAEDMTDVTIANNVFYQPMTDAINFSGGTLTNFVVENNITAGAPVSGSSPAGVTFLGNLDNVDPMFVDPTAFDFRLMPSSPAIDAGVTLGYVPNDFVGTCRPLGAGFDIGAFEQM